MPEPFAEFLLVLEYKTNNDCILFKLNAPRPLCSAHERLLWVYPTFSWRSEAGFGFGVCIVFIYKRQWFVADAIAQ